MAGYQRRNAHASGKDSKARQRPAYNIVLLPGPSLLPSSHLHLPQGVPFLSIAPLTPDSNSQTARFSFHRPRHHHGAVIRARFPPHGCEP